MAQTLPLYDAFSGDYDRFVDWSARLDYELPFLISLLRQHDVASILDTACGTGQHAIALAREGFCVTAVDASRAMIERARENVARKSIDVEVQVVEFGGLAQSGLGGFDAITCLGNSLPHATDEMALGETLRDWHRTLAPGGIIIVQSRNFDRVIEQKSRFMPPETHREGDQEWAFMRFYDQDGPIWRFNVVRMHRRGAQDWTLQIEHTMLRPWRYDELLATLETTGFVAPSVYGNLRGEPFDLHDSSDLVLIAQRS